ncbi:hypothetical protein BY996DRAFT_6454587 [Phakopsora pachyrhizi]|nr:hypothetical protein BY996DRAFT_6454587 [Phakopsora pachyrhizi]
MATKGSEEPNQAAPEEEEAEELDPYNLAEALGFRPTASCLKPAIKIKADYYDKLVKALAGRISDTNILCMIGAANCIKYLAKVLRSDFGKYPRQMRIRNIDEIGGKSHIFTYHSGIDDPQKAKVE